MFNEIPMSTEHSKKDAERIHTRRRAEERLGRPIGKHQYQVLNQKLQEKDSAQVRFLWRTSNTRAVYAVKMDGEWLPVAYNKRTKQAITILPLNVLDRYLHILGDEYVVRD